MPKMKSGEAQLGCIITEKAKIAVNLAAKITGKKLRYFIEEAIWHEIARLPKNQRAALEGLRGVKKK